MPAPDKCWQGDAPSLLRLASMDTEIPRDDPAELVNPCCCSHPHEQVGIQYTGLSWQSQERAV